LIQKGFSAFFGICGANATDAFLKRLNSQAGTYRLAVKNRERANNELRTGRDDVSGQIPHQRRDKISFNFQLVCNPNNRFRFPLVFRKDRVFRKINNRDDPKLLSPKRINAGRLSDARAGQNLRGGRPRSKEPPRPAAFLPLQANTGALRSIDQPDMYLSNC
jgi:hypothetical protein